MKTALIYSDRLKKYDFGAGQPFRRGRVFDNIFTERLWRTLKYEEVYLKDYDNCIDAKASIDDYFTFYNNERLHSSLGYSPPAEIYFDKDRIVSNIKV